MSGLQEGQDYQFSVSVTLLIDGQTYTSTPGDPFTAYISQLCIIATLRSFHSFSGYTIKHSHIFAIRNLCLLPKIFCIFMKSLRLHLNSPH